MQVRVAPNVDLIMAGNERIRARFTVGNCISGGRHQEGYQTDTTIGTELRVIKSRKKMLMMMYRW